MISRAESDPALLERGAAESRRLLGRVVAAIGIDAAIGQEIAQTLYAECVLRTIFGAGLFSATPESDADFRARLARTAVARTAAVAS